MASRFLAIGALTVLVAAAASSAVGSLHFNALQPKLEPGKARLTVVGTRSAAQRQSASGIKLDAVLADLSRHAALARPDHALADLHALSPAARFAQTAATGAPLVLIDATTRGDPQQLKAALQNLGLQQAAVYLNDVGGWLPVNQLDAAAGRAEVVSVRAAMPRARAGAVTSQGDFVQLSAAVRTGLSLDGTGVTVGVISDSFNCYAVYPGLGVPAAGNMGYAPNGFTANFATDVSTGDLPMSVSVLAEASCASYGAPYQTPFGDEGRAMLQVVHDVAPGAGLAFYTGANSEAAFASGIGALAAAPPAGAGAKVIADDLGYPDEPFFQDGIIAQAIDSVEAQGVAYFSAAGNGGVLSYQNTAPSFLTLSTSGATSGERLLNFDVTGATNTTSLPVTIPPIPPGDLLAIVVQWDQPYVTGAPGSPGASSSINLCVTGQGLTDIDGNPVSCTGPNPVGVDPVQILIIGNPANAAGNTAQQTVNIVVGLAPNSKGTAVPGRILVAVEDDGLGSTIDASFWSGGPTIQGHPGAAGAAAVGAAFYFDTPQCGTTPAKLENYSSAGGAPILFSTTGARLATPLVRQKPDFVGPDGGNDTFLGFTLASVNFPGTTNGQLNTAIAACQNVTAYPNFFGTSAATPHAAGIAALMLQASVAANPALTPARVYSALQNTALPMAGASPNFNSGYGFIQANTAMVVPVLSLSAPSIALGGSATLSWSAIDAASTCNASGGWSGVQPPSGSLVLTPAVAGTSTYTLTCTNATTVTTATGSATLTATSGAPPAAPTLSLAANAVAVGQSTTLSWSSVGATSCTASGSWNGAQATSGTYTVTPKVVGSETFTLVCSNLGGPSAPTSVILSATPSLTAPGTPVITLGASTVPAYGTTSLTWSSSKATSCLAAGSANAAISGWAGTQGPSGSISVTPTAVGSTTYSVTCSNAVGTSAASSVTLNVTPQLSGGSGALDEITLIGLAALACRGRRRGGSRRA